MHAEDVAKEFIFALRRAAESHELVEASAYLENAAAALDRLPKSEGELDSEYWRDQVRRDALLDAAEWLPNWRSQIDEGRRPELGPLVARLLHGQDWGRQVLRENPPDGPTDGGFVLGGRRLDLPILQLRLLCHLWTHRSARRDAVWQAVHGNGRRKPPKATDGLPSLAQRLTKSCKGARKIKISFPRNTDLVVLDVAN